MTRTCIISEISRKPRIPANPNANPPVQEVAAIATTWATFQINNAKLYVSVVILSINIKFLENIKQTTISWKKYRSEMTIQTKMNNLNYVFDPKSRNINIIDCFFFH